MSMNRLSPEQKRRRKKRIVTICVIVAVLIAAAAIGLVFLQRNITERFAQEDEREILSAAASLGSIRTTVSGSGNLSNEESEEVILPANVLLDEMFVRWQSSVEAGDLLATVSSESVITAMAEIQTALDELDEELGEAEAEEVDSYISAPVSGRVKAVNAVVGDDVSAIMYESGSLILLSLDGTMTVTLDLGKNEDASTGSGEPSEERVLPDFDLHDTVTVTESDGDSYEGSIIRIAGDVVEISLSDYGPSYGDEATVSIDGEELGKGILKIHEPLAVTGYAGTVDYLYVSTNEWVDAGETLLELTNTSYTAHYESLLQERRELEEELQTLIDIYQEGGIYAPISGKIDSRAYEDWNMPTTAEDTEVTLYTIRPSDTILATIYVDESDILNLSEGLEATVSVSSIEDEYFSAEVTEVASEGTSSGGVTQYAVTLSMPRTDNMRAGMSVSASISISGAATALLLPSDAIQSARESYYVYTYLDPETNSLSGMTRVELGVVGGSYTEILSGIAEGTTVYYYEADASGEMRFGGFGPSGEMPGGRR